MFIQNISTLVNGSSSLESFFILWHRNKLPEGLKPTSNCSLSMTIWEQRQVDVWEASVSSCPQKQTPWDSFKFISNSHPKKPPKGLPTSVIINWLGSFFLRALLELHWFCMEWAVMLRLRFLGLTSGRNGNAPYILGIKSLWWLHQQPWKAPWEMRELPCMLHN